VPPSHYQGYCFRIDEAKRLASLAGAEIDMRAVVDVCERLDALGDTSKLDFVLWEALSGAAVIRYGRCFKQGVRHYLPTRALSAAPHELQETHAFVIALRDKHVAHSVNPFEENEVTVQIGDHFNSSQEIISVNTAHGRVLGLLFGMPAQLGELAKWWLGWLNREGKIEREKLVSLARTFTLEALKRQPQGVLGADTGRHTVTKRRKRP
jgi:hypothetical protein